MNGSLTFTFIFTFTLIYIRTYIHRLVSDTEYIGMSTLTQMGQQREQLQIASDHLDGTTDAMHQARLILTSMRDKVWRNKVALQLIAMGLGLMNLMVIIWMWKNHHHK